MATKRLQRLLAAPTQNGGPCCCAEFHHRKAAPDAGTVAPRSPALTVRIARRDIASTGLSMEFRVTVASRSRTSSRIAFWFDASLG
jgi:hypothetical protein